MSASPSDLCRDFTLYRHDYRKPFRGLFGVRLILSDPPYNQGLGYSADRSKDDLSLEKYQMMCAAALREQASWLADGGTCWWIVPPSHAIWLAPMMDAVIGPRLYAIAWHEAFAQYQQKTLTADWRMILVHTNNPKKVVFRPDEIRVPSVRLEMGDKRADKRGRVPGTVWSFRRLQGTSKARVEWHPAQLPPELLQRVVKGWSDPRDLIVDGFAGSGSLGVEALKLSREFAGVERSAEYIRKMRTRLRAVQKEIDSARSLES